MTEWEIKNKHIKKISKQMIITDLILGTKNTLLIYD